MNNIFYQHNPNPQFGWFKYHAGLGVSQKCQLCWPKWLALCLMCTAVSFFLTGAHKKTQLFSQLGPSYKKKGPQNKVWSTNLFEALFHDSLSQSQLKCHPFASQLPKHPYPQAHKYWNSLLSTQYTVRKPCCTCKPLKVFNTNEGFSVKRFSPKWSSLRIYGSDAEEWVPYVWKCLLGS